MKAEGESTMKVANMAYHCGIIVEGVHDWRDDVYRQLAAVNVAHVERRLGEMLREIQASPQWQETGDLPRRLKFQFDPVKHALGYLAEFLDGKRVTDEEELTARIFSLYLYSEVPKLVRDFGYEETAE